MTISQRRQLSFPLLVVIAFLLSCKTGGPATPWEKVTAYNATFAESNQAIETGVQTLVATKILTVAQGQPVITWNLRAAEIHQQITALLGTGTSITSVNVATIQALLAQLQTSAQTLIASGTLGVKNPNTQNTVEQDITGLGSLATLILNLLPQLLASPAPSTTPAAPATKPSALIRAPDPPSNLRAIAFLAPADIVKVTMTATALMVSTGALVTLSIVATSTQGDITNVIFNCENGSAPVGQNPSAGALAVPNSRPLSGVLPNKVVCEYRKPGTFKPNVQVFDSLGKSASASVTVTVNAPMPGTPAVKTA